MVLNHANFCMCCLASAVNHFSTCKLKTQPTTHINRWPEHWSAWGFTLTWQAVHKALKKYFSRSGNLYPHAPTTLSIQHPTGPLRCSFNPAVKPQIWASPPATQIDPGTTGIHRFTNVVTHRLKTFYLFYFFSFLAFGTKKMGSTGCCKGIWDKVCLLPSICLFSVDWTRTDYSVLKKNVLKWFAKNCTKFSIWMNYSVMQSCIIFKK